MGDVGVMLHAAEKHVEEVLELSAGAASEAVPGVCVCVCLCLCMCVCVCGLVHSMETDA